MNKCGKFVVAFSLCVAACRGSNANKIFINDTDNKKNNYSLDTSISSYSCEQGLFFSLSGNKVFGGINFISTKSCLFVFKGEKVNKSYGIECADYDDTQLK